MLLRESTGLVLAGVLVGLAAVLAVVPLADRFLFGLSPIEPSILVAVPGALILMTLVAAFVPAWRESAK
jgi:hypothetical protein